MTADDERHGDGIEEETLPADTGSTRATDTGPARATRRSVLGGLAAATAGSLSIGSVAAGRVPAGAGRRRSVPTPTVEGPVTGGSATGGPQTASVVDLSAYGYVEEEYFVSGEAEATATIGESAAETAEYTTRVLVFRPEHRRDFNGTLVAEWPNVTNQRDVPVLYANAHDYVLREGYAFAIVSAQEVGVQDSAEDRDLVTWDPERYGDLHHPGDAYAPGIFSQAVQALRTPPGRRKRFDVDADPLGGFNVRTVLATGMSQSAYYLRAYINRVHEHHGVVDGFLPVAAGIVSEREDVRDDLAPVLWLNTENEAESGARPDAGAFRLWEVAGASHVNHWLAAYAQVSDARDFEGVDLEFDPGAAGHYGERPDAVYGQCGYFNYFPVRYAYASALAHLDEWVTKNREPPAAPRIEREDGAVRTDEYGNALGGLRLPPIDVPVARYDARSCGLLGRTVRFDGETLDELYPTHDEYAARMRAAIDDAVAAGYLLEPEAADLAARVERAPIGGQ